MPRPSSRELGATDDAIAPSDALPAGSASLRALAVERLEIAVEVYLFVADRSGHEDVVATAQDLAARGLDRVPRLR